MSTLVDDRFATLRGLGYAGTTSDMLLAWLLDNGASSPQITDAWSEFLAAKGFSGHRNDAWYEYLGSLGYTGTVNDRESAFWEGGDVTGPELITNGTFTPDGTGWTGGAAWLFPSGSAVASSATGTLNQDITGLLAIGKTYRVTYARLFNASGSVRVRLSGATQQDGTDWAADGVKVEDFTIAEAKTAFRFLPVGTYTGAITGVSIREVA